MALTYYLAGAMSGVCRGRGQEIVRKRRAIAQYLRSVCRAVNLLPSVINLDADSGVEWEREAVVARDLALVARADFFVLSYDNYVGSYGAGIETGYFLTTGKPLLVIASCKSVPMFVQNLPVVHEKVRLIHNRMEMDLVLPFFLSDIGAKMESEARNEPSYRRDLADVLFPEAQEFEKECLKVVGVDPNDESGFVIDTTSPSPPHTRTSSPSPTPELPRPPLREIDWKELAEKREPIETNIKKFTEPW